MSEKYIGHSDDWDFKEKIEKLLLYHKVVSVEGWEGETSATLVLDNGVKINTYGNQGCGGCSNGWYYLDELNHCDNVITKVEEVLEGDSETDIYHIFVYAEDQRINLLQYSGHDNGYYGRGYDLYIEV